MIELYTIPGCVWPRRQTVLPIDLSHQQFQRMQLSDRALFHILPAEVSGSASVYSWWGICLRPKNKRSCSDYTKCFLCGIFLVFVFSYRAAVCQQMYDKMMPSRLTNVSLLDMAAILDGPTVVPGKHDQSAQWNTVRSAYMQSAKCLKQEQKRYKVR